ncbi:MAG TPA: hypothetical protein VFP32_02870 [Candidatus Saccharimonadales bacterium]|nr:hypothetical protein [Candidatus Saccharimonadales bacterium]
MRFNREKFIDLLLVIQVIAEALDQGAFNIYCWTLLRARRMRRFIYRIPDGVFMAGAFIAGCTIEALSFGAQVYDPTTLNTITNCVGAAMIIWPLVYATIRLAPAGTHPLEGTRLRDGE